MSDCINTVSGPCAPIPQTSGYSAATPTPNFAGNGLTAALSQSQDINALALTSMNAFTVVKIGSGGVQPVSPSIPGDQSLAYGITLSSVAAGSNVAVRPFGMVFNNLSGAAGWNWTVGMPVWVGPNGLLQQLPNTSGWNLIVGTAVAQSGIEFGLPYTEPVIVPPTALNFTTATETLTVDATQTKALNVTLSNSGAILDITGGQDAQEIKLTVTQDATGGRTLTISPANLAGFTLTATANAVDMCTLRYVAAKAKWYPTSIVNNLT